MYRCLVCGQPNCICKGTAPQTGPVVDIPEAKPMAKGKLVRVQTGPTSYIKMTEDEAMAYRANQAGVAAPAKIVSSSPVQEPAPTSDGLDDLTVPVLTEQAKALDIDTKDMKKAEIIAAIRAKQGES